MSFLLRGLTSFLPKIGGVLGNIFSKGKSLLSNIFSGGSKVANTVSNVADSVGNAVDTGMGYANRFISGAKDLYGQAKNYIPQVGRTIQSVGDGLGRAGDASRQFGQGNQSPNDYANTMRGIGNSVRPDISNTIDGGRDLFNNARDNVREVQNVFQRN